MINTVFGTKVSQIQTWNQAGVRMPITVIKTTPMTVTQIKNTPEDGYQAIQVGFGIKKWQRINLPLQGHLTKSVKEKKNGASNKKDLAPRFLREIHVREPQKFNLGDTIDAAQVLKAGDLINATGISRGRGFAGVVKRWGFKGGPRTHGQSDRERAPGSIGQGTDPGRVHKGKKMPGHYGAASVTVRNLTVVRIDQKTGEIWLKGQVPGARNSLVLLKKIGENPKFTGLFDPTKVKKTAKTTKKVKQATDDQEKAVKQPKLKPKQTTKKLENNQKTDSK